MKTKTLPINDASDNPQEWSEQKLKNEIVALNVQLAETVSTSEVLRMERMKDALEARGWETECEDEGVTFTEIEEDDEE